MKVSRKLFAAVFAVSLLTALVIGAALAWAGSASGNYSSTAGTISVALYSVDATGNAVYPTATHIAVLTGGIQNNTPANPGIAVQVRDGVNAGSVTSIAALGCQAWLSGDVDRLDGAFINAGGYNADNLWQAWLQMNTDCPDSCQGVTINYDVTVNVQT